MKTTWMMVTLAALVACKGGAKKEAPAAAPAPGATAPAPIDAAPPPPPVVIDAAEAAPPPPPDGPATGAPIEVDAPPKAAFGKVAKLDVPAMAELQNVSFAQPACVSQDKSSWSAVAASAGNVTIAASACGASASGKFTVSLFTVDGQAMRPLATEDDEADEVGVVKLLGGEDATHGQIVCVEYFRVVGVKRTAGNYVCARQP